MLLKLLERRSPNSFVADDSYKISQSQLVDLVKVYKAQLAKYHQEVVHVFIEHKLPTIALLISSSELEITLVLVPRKLKKEVQQQSKIGITFNNNFDLIFTEKAIPNHPIEYSNKGIVFYTSGTTGTPKQKFWKWRQLLETNVLPQFQPSTRWLSAYSMDSFASFQTIIFGLAVAEQLYWIDPNQTINCLQDQCTVFNKVLSTPTFWRRNLLIDNSNYTVKSVSLGGEPVLQDFIDLLVSKLSLEKLTHIYASTEFGSIYSISDGKEGFPLSDLNKPRRNGNTLSVKNDELWIKPQQETTSLPTGDLVEIKDSRVLIVGRKEDIINIGGEKVLTGKVEQALLTIPAIEQVRVFGIRNPITGYIVAADIVSKKDTDQSEVRKEIKQLFQQGFSKAWMPRILNFVEEIELTRTGKIKRMYE